MTHQCIICGAVTDDGTHHIGYRVNLQVYSLFTCSVCSTPPAEATSDQEPESADDILDYVASLTAWLDLLAEKALDIAIGMWPFLPPGNSIDKYLAWERQQRRRADRSQFN